MRCALLTSSCACAPDEMIYDDVENGDEGGNSSLEYGWSSSEFESYGEQSDSEGRNGVPRSFLRSSHRKQVRVRSSAYDTYPGQPVWCWLTGRVNECFRVPVGGSRRAQVLAEEKGPTSRQRGAHMWNAARRGLGELLSACFRSTSPSSGRSVCTVTSLHAEVEPGLPDSATRCPSGAV